jgi:hypothetical protein
MGAFHSCLDVGQRVNQKKAALQVRFAFGLSSRMRHIVLPATPALWHRNAGGKGRDCTLSASKVNFALIACVPEVQCNGRDMQEAIIARAPLYPLCVMFRWQYRNFHRVSAQVLGC